MLNASKLTRTGALFTRLGGLFTRRLRDQIIIPYLLLATAIALTGTYLLLNAASQSLHERFNRQLLDAAQGAADSITQKEIAQLAGLRAIVFTQGFSEALAAGDKQTLNELIAPQALNYDFDRVMVFTADGAPLLDLPGGSDLSSSSRSPELAKLVESALRPTGDLDKASALIETSRGRVFFTAGPVKAGAETAGVLLVGTNLSTFLRLVARDSLSDGVNFYGAGGIPLGNTLVATSTSSLPPPVLPRGWYEEIRSDTRAALRFRTLAGSGDTYVEALGVVPGRGPDGRPPGAFGVMLQTRTLDAKLIETVWTLLPVFGLGLVLIVVLGIVLAARIDRPVAQLVNASNHVAQGNLQVRVPVKRRDELGVLADRFNGMVDGLRQLIFVKELFGRFVSPEVSERLLAGQIELGGEQRTVTVLFSDLREFTRLSEQHSAASIVDLLNEYYRAVVAAARRHGGIVNKFGGDSTLIVFGAPLDMPDHADRALATALEIREALAQLNAHRTKEGWELLTQGIGISTGVVVAGQVGSEDRMEYTVIGDAVNLSSRLQYLTKSLRKCDIIFSESTLDALATNDIFQYEDKGRVEVRGKQRGVRIFSLLGAGPFDWTLPPATGQSGDSETPKEVDALPDEELAAAAVH
jgi:adenylate cyclase